MNKTRLSRQTVFKQLAMCFLTLSLVLFLAWQLTMTSVSQSMAESIPAPPAAHSIMRGMDDNQRELEQDTVQEILRSPVWTQFNENIKQKLAARLDREDIPSQAQNKALKSLAAKRRELLAALIEIDPKAALKQAISAHDRNELPSLITQYLEQQIDESGDFLVKIVMNHDHHTGAMSGSKVEREVIIGHNRYEAFVYGRREGMTTKLNIPLHGIAINGKMAVDESPLRELEPDEYATNNVDLGRVTTVAGRVALAGKKLLYFAGPEELNRYLRDEIEWEAKIGPSRSPGATHPETAQELSTWTTGVKKLLFMKVDFSDRPGDPSPDAQSIMDNQVNPFYVSNSYNQTSLLTTVTPLLRMPQPSSFYAADGGRFYALLNDARAAALTAGYNTNLYDLDLVANTDIFEWQGIATVGYKGAEIDGEITLRVIAHELGHNYGNWHANRWLVTDGNPISPGGSHYEYGDDFDAMGYGGESDRHFNATFKYNLGWLSDAHVQTVSVSGTYRIFAHDLSVLSGIHALRIRSNVLGEPDYWVEFKQLINNPYARNGAAIRWFFPASTRATELLDLRPSTISVEDAPLQIGESFLIPNRHFKITVLGKGNTSPESLDIKIDFYKNPFDFDGDGRADISVYRPSDGIWYWLNSGSNNSFSAAQFGITADRITPADFDGDGKTDFAVFRPSSGVWYLWQSTSGFTAAQFGQSGDLPAPGDFDGDGKDDFAVFRPSTGIWYLNRSSAGFTAVQFGQTGDVPQTGDFDGDGKADISLYRASNGTWYCLNSSNNSLTAQAFGISGDLPDAMDFDGDGKTDLAVFRPASGTWYLQRSTAGFTAQQFGLAGDRPVGADYDGDGKADVAVFRPSSGIWYINRSTDGFYSQQFGLEEDTPIESAFVQ